MSATALPQPVPYTSAMEQIGADEAETISSLKESLLKIAQVTYQDSAHATRGVHAKSHALLRAELEVPVNLPPALAQGLFATPGRYPVVLRISTSPGDILDDKVSTPRGVGIKVFGVKGERLPGSESLRTQDFLMVNGPAFLAPDAKGFSRSLKLLASTTDKAEGAKKILSAALRGLETLVESVGGESGTLKGLGGHPLTHPLGETYFTQVPFLHGDYMAKFSLAPASSAMKALKDVLVDLKDKPNGLREAIAQFFTLQGGEWELRAQLCTDLDTMPIEDASVVWPQDQSSHEVVGRIVVARHNPLTDADVVEAEDQLFFSPWTGLAAHRPLGSINRARKQAYEASAQFRAQRNGVSSTAKAQTAEVCPVAHA
jgi:hypothetical protein